MTASWLSFILVLESGFCTSTSDSDAMGDDISLIMAEHNTVCALDEIEEPATRFAAINVGQGSMNFFWNDQGCIVYDAGSNISNFSFVNKDETIFEPGNFDNARQFFVLYNCEPCLYEAVGKKEYVTVDDAHTMIRLAHCEQAILDEVIFHELLHLKHYLEERLDISTVPGRCPGSRQYCRKRIHTTKGKAFTIYLSRRKRSIF
jgi:hypothetical protein